MRILEITGKSVDEILNETEDEATKSSLKTASAATKKAKDLQPKKPKKPKKPKTKA